MTIAHKTKTKITKIFKKYSYDIVVINHYNNKIATFESITNSKFKNNPNNLRLNLFYL